MATTTVPRAVYFLGSGDARATTRQEWTARFLLNRLRTGQQSTRRQWLAWLASHARLPSGALSPEQEQPSDGQTSTEEYCSRRTRRADQWTLQHLRLVLS